MDLIRYIKDVNGLLVVLDILFLIISFLFFAKKKCSTRVKDIFVIIYTLVNMLLFSGINNMFNTIFTFKFLSVKTYLVVFLIALLILLYTFNKRVRLGYRICNYLVSIITSIIFLVNGYIFISDKLNIGNIIDISNVIVLMNVSFIVFSIYLIILSIIYISYYVYEFKLGNNEKIVKNNNSDKKIKLNIRLNIVERIKKIIVRKKNKENNKIKKISLKKIKLKKKEVVKNDNDIDTYNKEDNSLEKLISYNIGDSFYINGIDCSIIFCDSNKENILRNYDILSQDISAKMVNGYTLDENIMIRDILKKLNVSNLGSVDINNSVLLNLIDADEYMFLKEILGRN